ncbi:MAG: acyl carrier protein [Desulfuromonadales bacterium]|nr:acyl carrier protein [Desulfuromonadales bacterium]
MAVYTEKEVFCQVREAMVDLFELEEDAVKREAHLFQDLGLDSIDAVDLVVRLKNTTGMKVTPDDFKTVRTVEDVVQIVHKLISGDND